MSEVSISDRAKRAIAEKIVLLESGYLSQLRDKHSPALLRGIDRIKQFAVETGYRVDPETSEQLWNVFENEYCAEEKQKCHDIYMKTMVGYKSRCDNELLRRATGMTLSS